MMAAWWPDKWPAWATGQTISVLFAVVFGGVYLLSCIRCRELNAQEIQTLVLVALAGYAIPGGGKLVVAAIQGTVPRDTDWRLYLSISGVVIVGVSGVYLIKAIPKAWARARRPEGTEADKPKE